MQACFSLTHEDDPKLRCSVIGHKTPEDTGITHLLPLEAFPSIGMREDIVDVVCMRGVCPELCTVGMCFLDVRPGTFEEVTQEVGEDIDNGFSFWKRRDG